MCQDPCVSMSTSEPGITRKQAQDNCVRESLIEGGKAAAWAGALSGACQVAELPAEGKHLSLHWASGRPASLSSCLCFIAYEQSTALVNTACYKSQCALTPGLCAWPRHYGAFGQPVPADVPQSAGRQREDGADCKHPR